MDPAVDLAAIELLRSRSGQRLLAELPPYEPASALEVSTRLRTNAQPGLVAAVLTQARLRATATRRLGPAGARLLWTADTVEQASRLSVARWRAERLLRAGATRVLDLGAGAGSDALAFAAAGLRVIAVERDPVVAAVLEHNAGVAGNGLVRVWRGRAEDAWALLGECDAVFADPARRAHGRRLLDPADWSPPLGLVARFARAVPLAAAKVGPGIAHHSLPADAGSEWVSEGGDLLECTLWWGAGQSRHTRVATLLGPPERSMTAEPGVRADVLPPGRYLHEPDPAVIRAGAVADLAHALGGGLLDPTIAYITTDADRRSPFATRYVITHVLPFSVKALRAELRNRNVGRVTIKKRGTAVTPEQLRPALRLRGTAEATVVLTRTAGKHVALLVEPDQGPLCPSAGQREGRSCG